MSSIARGIVALGVLASAFGVANAKAVTQLDHFKICATDLKYTHDRIDNAFFPLLPGQVSTFLGKEAGEPLGLKIEVLEGPRSTERVARVTTRVVIETEWVDDDGDGEVGDLPDEPLIEVSRNYFAQVENGPMPGAVCYFGEEVTIYDDNGQPLEGPEGSAGSWRAGVGQNTPGLFMPATPEKGQFFQTESAPGVAMDQATITAVGRFVRVPAESGRVEAIKVRDCNPLERPVSCGTKYYSPGLGLIVDGPVALTDFDG